MNKKILFISTFALSILIGKGDSYAHQQYPQYVQNQQQKMVPGKQTTTGWGSGQNQGQAAYQQNQNRPSYVPNQAQQQQITTPYNYYGFPQVGPQGVRVTNGLPGYGKVQNPYQSADSEKGFYIFAGFSMGKDSGKGVVSEIQSDDGVPGNWIGRSMGSTNAFSIGAGTHLSGSLRIDFGYSSYSGLQYYSKAIEFEGDPELDEGPIEHKVLESDGISSDNFSIGFYYSMKDIFGDFLGGLFVPYVGGSAGFSYNKLGSYTLEKLGNTDLFDDSPCLNGSTSANVCEEVYGDGLARYVGTVTPSVSIGFEAGLTMNIQEKVALDFYYKNNRLGTLSTSGEVLTTESTFLVYALDAADPSCEPGMSYHTDPDDDTSPFICYMYGGDDIKLKTSRKESGDLSIWEFGVKLRAQF